MFIFKEDGTIQPTTFAPVPKEAAAVVNPPPKRDASTTTPSEEPSTSFIKFLSISTWTGMLLGSTIFIFYFFLFFHRLFFNRPLLVLTLHKYAVVLVLSLILIIGSVFVQTILPPI
jgi:hypothetical protein